MQTLHCLGSGLVGAFVVRHLVKAGHDVHVYDLKASDVDGITMHIGDITNELGQIPEGLVVNMLPGDIGGMCTENLVKLGRKVVDLSFAEETPERLHEQALASNATVVWDVGIAPGLSNMLLAEAQAKLGKFTNAEIRVGGNPSQPDEKWSYMAPFSPADVIAEYTRPARVIRNSTITTLPALDERHLIEVHGKGEMEAFLSDGLRSLLFTMSAQEMSEYTVRWPGHIQRYIDQRDTGVIDIEALLDSWAFDKDRDEFTWMEVKAENETHRHIWTVQDKGSDEDSSMARTTGLVTIATVLTMCEHENILSPGVYSPEQLPQPFLDQALSLMVKAGVSIEHHIERAD
ncbi:MAG TPA: saccharopine dehydrogenase C-terminal domain-containing protein [Poseidonia sp.]|nr:saccharopine dehydrogenase C-terminal domain-containing protein [Poseidonia sp.]